MKKKYIFKLYVVNSATMSMAAEKNIKKILKQTLNKKQYEFSVIDIVENFDQAEVDGVIATPTLVLETEKHTRKIVGDFSDIKKIIKQLGLYGRHINI